MYGEFLIFPNRMMWYLRDGLLGGEVFRSGCTFTRGLGKIFYFQPGHEEYPIYHMPVIQKIIKKWGTLVRSCSTKTGTTG